MVSPDFLTLLAPYIQEQLLFAESVDGVEPMSERGMRLISAYENWTKQREAWRSSLSTGQSRFPNNSTRLLYEDGTANILYGCAPTSQATSSVQ